MKIYDEGTEPLHELLRSASSEQGSTLLIPDLQRPYVWSPDQVTLLVDSLLRGWPFGTLLLWSVHKEDLAGIPSRPFWRVADRTEQFDEDKVSKSNPPAQFRMVLDGQQRLQSLLLAFGGDSWGFRLLDHEWSTLLGSERPRGRNAKSHWSLGHLCVDINEFKERISAVNNVAKVDFRDALSWVVLSPDHGRSAIKKPAGYRHPIPSALDDSNKGRYIRLSRLWDAASIQPGLFEKHFREKLKKLLEEHHVTTEVISTVLEPLAELVVTLVGIKQSKVSYLELSPFNDEIFSQDVYNDAIVNIFTRLNTAGRALTRQEITFAWIKNGWDASQTENKTAGKCFDEFGDSLASSGINLNIDELVSVVSAMWSMLHRDGALLTATDLLRGEKVRPMAQDLVLSWKTFVSNAIEAAQLIDERGLKYGAQYRSLNVLTLLFCWRLLGSQWMATTQCNVVTKDSFEKSLNAAFSTFSDRWLLLSQWSGRWGKSTDKVFAEYIKDLAQDQAYIRTTTSPDNVISTLTNRMSKWIEALQTDSIKYVDDLSALTRGAVHQYHLPLWVWHRLGAQRWKASALQLRQSKKGNLSIEVDHIVAVKLWEKLDGFKTLEIEAPVSDSALAIDDFSSTINSIGNCCLLEKTFNIIKAAEPLNVFLEDVHEFKKGELNIETWASDLEINKFLVNPLHHKALEIRVAIEERTREIKSDLRNYILNLSQRSDI